MSLKFKDHFRTPWKTGMMLTMFLMIACIIMTFFEDWLEVSYWIGTWILVPLMIITGTGNFIYEARTRGIWQQWWLVKWFKSWKG